MVKFFWELNTWLLIIDKMLISTMETDGGLHFTVAVTTDIHMGITGLATELLSLFVNALYEYMRVFASHLFNPLVVSLDELRTLLVHVNGTLKLIQD